MKPILEDEIICTYMRLAYVIATESPDPSTQNGAVIVTKRISHVFSIVEACNDFPKGVTPEFERPGKYHRIEHAERAVIHKAAKRGISTDGAVMMCPWAACSDCARAIVGAGISTLYRHYREVDYKNERWLESITVGDEILREGGVQVINWQGSLSPSTPSVRRNSLSYSPSRDK